MQVAFCVAFECSNGQTTELLRDSQEAKIVFVRLIYAVTHVLCSAQGQTNLAEMRARFTDVKSVKTKVTTAVT